MENGKKENESKKANILSSIDLITIYCDQMVLHKRKDGNYIMRWLQNVPEGNFERSRIMINEELVKKVIDILCSNSNYYPVPQKTEKQSS